jgi:hypothetical protein
VVMMLMGNISLKLSLVFKPYNLDELLQTF